ncbi:hypothetical protein [Mucilaginibacter sp.]
MAFLLTDMIIFIPIVILFFSLIIALQFLIYRIIIKNALTKYIEPKLKEKGFIFIDYKWPGLLSNGEFKPDDIALSVMNKNGNASISNYAYIFYKDVNDTKKVTAKIDTTLLSITSVSFSSDF